MSIVPRGPRRNRYRNDPRPRVAELAREYASLWSIYVQWDVARRRLTQQGVDTSGMDGYFDGMLEACGRQLAEAMRPLYTLAPLQPPSEGVSAAPDSLDNKLTEG